MKSVVFAKFNRRALSVALASVATLAGTGLVSNVHAATATATATSTVIVPIAITKSADLSFGRFSRGASGDTSAGGTVVISNNGTRSSTGGVLLAVAGSTLTAAKFDVTGEPSATYAISHTNTSLTNTTSGVTSSMSLATTSDLTGSNVTSGNVATGTLGTDGKQSIFVGGTLTVNATQAAGAYTGNVTVTVDYN